MVKRLPENFTNPLGGNSFQYVLAWFFIASWTFIDPGFFQRCAAAKTPKAARSGILISILFWSVFDFLTITCALYAVGIVTTETAFLTFPLIMIRHDDYVAVLQIYPAKGELPRQPPVPMCVIHVYGAGWVQLGMESNSSEWRSIIRRKLRSC